VAQNRRSFQRILVGAITVVPLTTGCTSSHDPKPRTAQPSASSSVSAGAAVASRADANELTVTGTTLDGALIQFRYANKVYPTFVTLEDPHSLRLKTRGVASLVDDDRLAADVTLTWYRPYPDHRLGPTGTSPGVRGAFSYCMSVAGKHRGVSANPAVVNVTEGKGPCPAPPVRPGS
jgi:hypothetical protein